MLPSGRSAYFSRQACTLGEGSGPGPGPAIAVGRNLKTRLGSGDPCLTNCLTTGACSADSGGRRGTGGCSGGRWGTSTDGLGMLDTEEVTGSNPVSPTSDERPLTCGNAAQGPFSSPPELGAILPPSLW